jgi:DNA-binding NarL/FixJ family response regulator
VVLSSDHEEPISIRSGARARLTARERAVLAASATGLVLTGVADALDLSPEAVRAALASAIAKLGARSKLEAVIVALRDGMIDLPGR